MLPPWPGWDGLHPLVIDFPIALLLVFAAVRRVVDGPAEASRRVRRLGGGDAGARNGGVFIAVETGEAAAELATRSDAGSTLPSRAMRPWPKRLATSSPA